MHTALAYPVSGAWLRTGSKVPGTACSWQQWTVAEWDRKQPARLLLEGVLLCCLAWKPRQLVMPASVLAVRMLRMCHSLLMT